MSGSSRRTPQKEGDQSPAPILSPSRMIIQSPSSVGELVDQHQQLLHEAGGLKLQLAAKQEILDRVVDLLDSSVAELASAKKAIEAQATTIRDLTQILQAAGKSENAIENAVDTSERKDNIETKNKKANNQPHQQPPPSTTATNAAVPAVLAAIESSSKPSENSNNDTFTGFQRLTVELNELEDFITGGTNIIKESTATTAIGTTHHHQQQPIITPVSARDRIAAFEKASKEAMLIQQRDLIINKSPELAPQCKITAAARAGSGDGVGGKGKTKKKKGRPTSVS
ncbi:hypothetical protein Ndes2526B_g06384 [Nannochloris sp. 'desiccata']|nr:hypothetical protein KSW81_008148 [Chlorella desiccata (nom. nud.)]KAH7619411.1 hypothetical protein NADE_006253 [Chlorella desiccata (nom. nud.)]